MPKTSSVTQVSSVKIDTSPDVRPAMNDNWQVRRELAAVLRRLNSVTLTADAPTELLQSVLVSLQAEAARVEASERVFGHRMHAERIAAREGFAPDMFYEMSPAIGQSNANAPPMHVWLEDGRIHARVTPDWSYEGPAKCLHGGVIALLFDQLLGLTQHTVGAGGLTGALTIRYHHPTPIDKPLRLVAEVDRVEGRKRFLVGELWADDVRTASCEGLFIARRTPAVAVTLGS